MMKRINFLFFSCLLSISLSAQEQLSLQDAIIKGLENNLSIKISEKARDIGVNDYDKSIGEYLPQVSVTAGKNFSTSNVVQQFVNDNEPRTIDGAKANTLDISPLLNWTIFDGLGMFYARDRFEQQMNLVEDDLKVQIENTIAQISSAFYTLALEEERLRVLKDAFELSGKRVDFAKVRYEVGKTSKLEYLQAQVDYNTDQSNIMLQEEVVANTLVDLNRLMGEALEKNYAVPTEFVPDIEMNLNTLLQSSQLNNPGLVRAQRARELSLTQLREINAERLPTVNFNLGYNFNDRNSDAGFLISNTSKGVNYGFTASWNILNGFDVKRRQQNAKITIESRELEVQDLRQQLEADVRKVFVNYQNSLSLRTLEETNYEIAVENFDIAQERYRLGNSNALELREAQVNLVQAELRKVLAGYNIKMAEIELKRLAGQNLK